MDTKKIDDILTHFIMIALPDKKEDPSGPATLYKIPKEAINAYIGMTRDLSEKKEEIEKLAVEEAAKRNPGAFLEFHMKTQAGIETTDNDVAFMVEVLSEPKYTNVLNTIITMGILRIREEWGEEEFHRDYSVTDAEEIQEFTEGTSWKTFEPGKGWGEGKTAEDSMQTDDEGNILNIKYASLDD